MFSCYIKSAVSTHNIQAKQFLRYSSEIVALKLKKPSTSLHKRSKLVDKVRLYIKGGSGGQGCLSAGGVGGKGGSVYIKCVKGASLGQYTLLRNRRVVAGHGSNYKKGRLKVISGQDAYVLVPPGTEVRSGNNVLITDLNKEEQIIKVANGGAAGSAKTTDFNGLRGESKNIVLELKTIADVALTGFPNAGKSSLLCALSRARPKVGNYPFTTIRPMVGSIFYSDSRQITVADLPGLIEDAHMNKGMGHRFLRHVERTKTILLVVDINGFQLKEDQPYRSPFDTVVLLLKELALYKDILLQRPFFLLLNKMDAKSAEEKRFKLFDELTSVNMQHKLLHDHVYADQIISNLKQLSESNFDNILSVSAKYEHGLELLKKRIHQSVPVDESAY